jgi:hypothetical protein
LCFNSGWGIEKRCENQKEEYEKFKRRRNLSGGEWAFIFWEIFKV